MSDKLIFVVDDNPDQAYLITVVLRRNDYHNVSSFLSASEALLSSEKPDLFITDYNMPNMNGGELVRILKERGPLPIIMISADYQSAAYGFDAFLKKPYNINELLNLVHRFLD